MAQTPPRSGYDLLVRASDDPDAAVEPVWRAIAALVPEYRRSRVQSYRALLAPQEAPWRVGVILSVAAAALAILLSTIGAYAVLSFAVRQRRHEFGVRRALGAGASHVLRLVAASGAAAACSGVVAGLVAFLALGKFVTPLLYHVPARDPVVAGAAAAVLVAAAMGAALAAGALALRVPPTEALQAE